MYLKIIDYANIQTVDISCLAIFIFSEIQLIFWNIYLNCYICELHISTKLTNTNLILDENYLYKRSALFLVLCNLLALKKNGMFNESLCH